MKFECLGEILDFNPLNQNITIKCDFLSPENLGILEEVIKERRKALKISFNFSPKKTKQWHQQKCWWGSISLILKAKGVDLTKENVQVEDEEQRRSIFPVHTYLLDGTARRRIKRMSEMSFDEMQRSIELLHERHQHLKVNDRQIDFSNLKLIRD